MQPRIETLKETYLVGFNTRMSFKNNKSYELWKGFMPRRQEIKNAVNSTLFSVEVYDDTTFFESFHPDKEFEKWAAVAVTDFEHVPEGMNTMTVPAGLYAVFHYKGKPSEAQSTFQYIYGHWLPQSGYKLDDRPHFAMMDEKYKGEHPDSEEDFWIPLKKR